MPQVRTRQGHFASWCRANVSANKSLVIYTLSRGLGELEVEILINGSRVRCPVDTRTTATLMNKQDVVVGADIKESRVQSRSYCGQVIQVLEELECTLGLAEKPVRGRMLVVPKARSVLGRDILA